MRRAINCYVDASSVVGGDVSEAGVDDIDANVRGIVAMYISVWEIMVLMVGQ